nr:hypothetical protein [Sphingosinicella sp. CPCC 101087]
MTAFPSAIADHAREKGFDFRSVGPSGIERGDGTDPVMNAQRTESSGHVNLHGALRNVQYTGNFLVGLARGELLEHFALSSGEGKVELIAARRVPHLGSVRDYLRDIDVSRQDGPERSAQIFHPQVLWNAAMSSSRERLEHLAALAAGREDDQHQHRIGQPQLAKAFGTAEPRQTHVQNDEIDSLRFLQQAQRFGITRGISMVPQRELLLQE